MLRKMILYSKEIMTLFVYGSDPSDVNAASEISADFVAIIIIKKC